MAVPVGETKFRSRLVPTFLLYTVLTQLGYLTLMTPLAVAVTLLDPRAGGVWWAVLGGCGMCGLISVAAAPLLVWGFPVYVSPAGLRGYNFWGVYHTARWDAITAARVLNLGVGPTVRVFAADAWLSLWVPLYLDDMDHFAELVREYAGPDHPLAAVLARHAADEED